jgi:excisionase family DNA binding protein
MSNVWRLTQIETMVLATNQDIPSIPTEAEVILSAASSRALATYLNPEQTTQTLRMTAADGREQEVEIPSTALYLLVDILNHLAAGDAISLNPIHPELTTQEAADLLNVSRPYLIKLLENGDIDHRKVGKDRRVLYTDLMAYKQQSYQRKSAALDELVAQAQELDMGY